MSAFADLPAGAAAAALELCKRGYAVFPCSPRNKAPYIAGGFKSASREPQVIEGWWRQYPKALIGLPTGAVNRVWALDVDAKHAPEGNVDEVLEALELECDARFSGPRIQTIHHGRHVYFAHDARIRIGAGRFRTGVDWRGEGGYVIAPDGERYFLVADGAIEPAPESLIHLIANAQGHHSSSATNGARGTGFAGMGYERTLAEWVAAALTEGSRHDGMVHVVWELVRRGLSLEDILALAPMFPQPIRDIHIAAEGAFAKQERNPAGDEQAKRDQFGERLVAFAFDPAAVAALKPREWLYGHLAIRRFVSLVGAPGGVGKTAYMTSVALAMASGQPLLGEVIHKRSRVWLYNLEDPIEEQYRRLDAAMKLHHVTAADVEGYLFLASGRDQRLCIAAQTKDGIPALTPHVDMMTSEILGRQIDVVIIDPFVKSHQLNENDNVQIDAAATAWSEVAEKAACAPILVHHFRKGSSGDVDGADSFRGASALIDAARCAVSLKPMSEEEAERVNISPSDRLRMVRLDNAKLNLAPRPEETFWLELVGVTIATGDNVQAVRRHQTSGIFADLDFDAVNQILDEIANAAPPYSPASQAARWVGHAVINTAAQQGVEIARGRAAAIIATWLKSGCLRIVDEHDIKRNLRKAVRVNPSKRPGVDP